MIRKYVEVGSHIWTHGHKSYVWLDSTLDFEHESVIHRRGGFAKLLASGVKRPTNAIEGLFSKMKRLLRTHQASL